MVAEVLERGCMHAVNFCALNTLIKILEEKHSAVSQAQYACCNRFYALIFQHIAFLCSHTNVYARTIIRESERESEHNAEYDFFFVQYCKNLTNSLGYFMK